MLRCVCMCLWCVCTCCVCVCVCVCVACVHVCVRVSVVYVYMCACVCVYAYVACMYACVVCVPVSPGNSCPHTLPGFAWWFRLYRHSSGVCLCVVHVCVCVTTQYSRKGALSSATGQTEPSVTHN